MTTIAYRDGVLAGDSRVSCGDMVVDNKAVKVHRIRGNRLLGWAGKVEDAERLKLALRKKETPPANLDVDAIMVHMVNGAPMIQLFEGNLWVTQKGQPYYAIGSGAPYALGAMDAGATAQEAASIGSKRDVASGGKIRSVRFK